MRVLLLFVVPALVAGCVPTSDDGGGGGEGEGEGEGEGDASGGQLLVADPSDPTFSVCASDAIRSCTFDFGAVAVGSTRPFRFLMRNISAVDIAVGSSALTADSAPAFAVTAPPPTTIAPGAQALVEVSFTPTGVAPVAGALLIETNASNLAGEPLRVDLTGSGMQ